MKPLLRPNLPSGEYKLIFKAVYKCDLMNINETIQLNIHLSQKSSYGTEYVGNVTLLEPLNDDLDVNVNMAVMDKIGGWKPNAYVYSSNKACSTVKRFYGRTFHTFLGIEHAECPVAKGVYNVRYDTKNFENTFKPAVFFYGKYRFKQFYTNKQNTVVGCNIAAVDVVRPWDTEGNY
ncbi:uncharacterized protein LOC126835853 [Adelges cooleyi]|uniref:uncharacterized protein LOC126835853 n=1 Tax=Adelges cooleyi TaxID=133065 RepID=UPI0021801A25|nr:uncharacterized protein LOC126835853 [Adelges cooleyi]